MHKTGIEDYYITKNNKKLRYGYTTGTCAAAAAKAAAMAIVTGIIPEYVEIDTPKGIHLTLQVSGSFKEKNAALCTVLKDSGDDPDVTDKMPVCALVSFSDKDGIVIDGGEGVGRVTKPGLWQAVGEAAINRVPKQMITEELQKIREDFEIKNGFNAEIILPKGKEQRRF